MYIKAVVFQYTDLVYISAVSGCLELKGFFVLTSQALNHETYSIMSFANKNRFGYV